MPSLLVTEVSCNLDLQSNFCREQSEDVLFLVFHARVCVRANVRACVCGV